MDQVDHQNPIFSPVQFHILDLGLLPHNLFRLLGFHSQQQGITREQVMSLEAEQQVRRKKEVML